MDVKGDRIRGLRIEKKLTQEALGKMVRVSTQVISNWERGYTPNIDDNSLSRLADALNATTDYLLGRTDVRNYSDDYQSAARPVERADIMVESIKRLVEEQAERVIRERGLEPPGKPKK